MGERKGFLSAIGERVGRHFRERDERNQGFVLTAIESLSLEGQVEVTGYQIVKKDAELRHPNNPNGLFSMMPYGSLYLALRHLEQKGALRSRRVVDEKGPKWLYSKTPSTQRDISKLAKSV